MILIEKNTFFRGLTTGYEPLIYTARHSLAAMTSVGPCNFFPTQRTTP